MSNQDTTANKGSIIYNVTVKVDTAIAEEWLQWLLTEHAPAILATQYFTDYKVVKLLEVDDTEGPTYAIQYQATSLEAYTKYMDEFSFALRRQSFEKWGQRAVDFSTIMEVIR